MLGGEGLWVRSKPRSSPEVSLPSQLTVRIVLIISKLDPKPPYQTTLRIVEVVVTVLVKISQLDYTE